MWICGSQINLGIRGSKAVAEKAGNPRLQKVSIPRYLYNLGFPEMKLSTCLLVARIYPIHIKKIGVVQWYVLCPILSFFCIIIIHTYVF
jgi:hypothetical protein